MNEQRFLARVSLGKTALLVAGAIGFVAICGWIVATVTFDDNPKAVIASWVGVPFFAACAIVGMRQMFHADPVLEIDQHGILWRRWSDDTIPWSAISGMSVTQVRRSRFLNLKLVDPARYPSSSLLGKLSAANRAMTGGDISLAPTGTDRGFDELLEAIDRFAPKAIR